MKEKNERFDLIYSILVIKSANILISNKVGLGKWTSDERIRYIKIHEFGNNVPNYVSHSSSLLLNQNRSQNSQEILRIQVHLEYLISSTE